MPHWDDLRLFLSVARAGGLTGAAKAERLDPATLGRRVQRLEEALDTRLFAKSPQGYELTQAGSALFERAEAAEAAMRAALDEPAAAGDADGISGTIRLGAPDGCANYILPQLCAGIRDDHPGLEIQIVALPRVFNLSKREADMAITVSRPAAGRLTVQRLADYRLHLAASEAYLDRAGPIRDKAALKDHPIVGYIPDLIFDRELDYLAELDCDRPDIASNSVPVQLGLVRSGAGLAIVHDFALPFAPGVRKVLADQVSLTRSFYLVRHADDRRVTRLARFADLLAGRFRAEIARLEALT